jgi:hypothetical protein
MASMLSHATVDQQPAEKVSVHVVDAPRRHAASGESVEELDRSLTDGLKVLQDGAPKDPSYWVG